MLFVADSNVKQQANVAFVYIRELVLYKERKDSNGHMARELVSKQIKINIKLTFVLPRRVRVYVFSY